MSSNNVSQNFQHHFTALNSLLLLKNYIIFIYYSKETEKTAPDTRTEKNQAKRMNSGN